MSTARCLAAAWLLPIAILSAATVHRNIQYGEARGVVLLMDVSIPDGVGPFPVAVLVHGGAWVAGDKANSFQPIRKPLADAGFVIFSINYRLAPKFLFPSAVHDVETAVRFIDANAASYHIDPERVVLFGESAGAQLVDMAAVDRQTHVAGVVSFYGPSDLAGLAKSGTVPDAVRQMAGDSPITDIVLQSLRQLSPIERVSKDMPPFLFIHGTEDKVVPFESSTGMCEEMEKVQAVCQVIAVPGGDHGMSTWEAHPEMQVYKQLMMEWLRRTLSRAGHT